MPNLLIVDGQQRLTSLFAVIKGVSIVRETYEKERIDIAFRPTDETFDVARRRHSKRPVSSSPTYPSSGPRMPIFSTLSETTSKI